MEEVSTVVFRQAPEKYRSWHLFLFNRYLRKVLPILFASIIAAGIGRKLGGVDAMILSFVFTFILCSLAVYFLPIREFFTFIHITDAGIHVTERLRVDKSFVIDFININKIVDRDFSIDIFFMQNGKKKRLRIYRESLGNFIILISLLVCKNKEISCYQIQWPWSYLGKGMTLLDYLKRNTSSWEK